MKMLQNLFFLLSLVHLVSISGMNWWPEPKERRTKFRQELAKQEEERKQAATTALAELLLSADF